MTYDLMSFSHLKGPVSHCAAVQQKREILTVHACFSSTTCRYEHAYKAIKGFIVCITGKGKPHTRSVCWGVPHREDDRLGPSAL